MPASLNAAHPIIRWTFYANLLLLMLAVRAAEWTHATVMLPWLITLTCADARVGVFQIVHARKMLTSLTLTLSVLILLSSIWHGCAWFGIEVAAIPLLWIPIAALTRSIQWRHHRTALIITISIAICWISLLVIWQFTVGHEPRPKGLSHNVLTGPMLLGMLCTIGALSHPRENNRLRQVLAALSITASIVTQSKTGLLAFLAASLIYIIRQSASRKRMLFTATPVIFIWLLTLTQRLSTFQSQFTGYENKQYKNALGGRADAIRWVKSHFMDNPLLGKGPEQLAYEFDHRWQEWGRSEFSTLPMLHLHNDYFQILMTYGIPASICFTALWITLSIQAFKSTNNCRSNSTSTATWILMLTSIYMISFITDSFTYWDNAWAMVSACMGLSIGILSSKQEKYAYANHA